MASAKELCWPWELQQYQKQVWMQLALRSHCWFMFALLLTRTPRPFSAQLLLWQSALARIPSRSRTEFSPVGLHKVPVGHFTNGENLVSCHSQIWWQKVPSYILVMDKDMERFLCQFWSLRDVAGYQGTSSSYSLHSPLIQSVSHPFAGQSSVRDCVKGSRKSKYTRSSALCTTLVSSLWKMMRRINF